MICTARKDIRRNKGNARVNATSLAFFIKPYKEPQGNAVVTRIVGVAAANDDLTPCTCRAGRLDNCTCLPDARLQDDRTVLLSPMVTPNVNSKAAAGGRQYKVSFESKSADTGLACRGEAFVCAIKWAKKVLPEDQRPACAAFESTQKARDATVCT